MNGNFAGAEKGKAARSFLRLSAEEPFRIFFPLGLLFGLAGVGLWPLFLNGTISVYPATMHARLMIEGMMASFVFGFLGTAGPRLLGVPHLTGRELGTVLTLLITSSTLHLIQLHAAADTAFFVALGFFCLTMGRRFRERQDSPPPHFALVVLGIMCGLFGSLALAWSEWAGGLVFVHRAGNNLLNTGFILLPLLGVAPFFLRRLLVLPSEESGRFAVRLLAAMAAGLTIVITLIFEAATTSSAAAWLRWSVAFIYVAATMPRQGSNLLASGLRLSLSLSLAGLALFALVPAYPISASHVIFIGGFTVAVLSVAARVVLGHSGNLALLQRRAGVFWIALVLVIFAMIARFVADFVPSRDAHLFWGAICWLLGAAVWTALVLPHVTKSEE